MITNFNSYKEIVTETLEKVPILYTKQLVLMLMNYDENLTPDSAMMILKVIQKTGHVLLSKSGWAMTKAGYQHLTNDKFYDSLQLNQEYRLKDVFDVYSPKAFMYNEDNQSAIQKKYISDLISERRQEIINCMWIVADLYPNSRDFIISQAPWSIRFINYPERDNEQSICYEIAYVPKKSENALLFMIGKDQPVRKEIRKNIERIVIMENEAHTWMVPYIGVSHICKLDSKSEIGYMSVEQRSDEERWKQYAGK